MNQEYGTREKRKEKIIKLIEMFFGEEKMRTMIRGFIQILPSGPVKPGDSWESAIDIEHLQRSEIDLRNTLKNRDKDKVIIDSAYRKDRDGKPIKEKNNPNMIFTEIDYKGTAQIDESSGWIVRKEIKASVLGEFRHQRITLPWSVDIIRIIEPVESAAGDTRTP